MQSPQTYSAPVEASHRLPALEVDTLAVASADYISSLANFIIAASVRIRNAVGTIDVGPLHI